MCDAPHIKSLSKRNRPCVDNGRITIGEFQFVTFCSALAFFCEWDKKRKDVIIVVHKEAVCE